MDNRASMKNVVAGDTVGIVIGTNNVFHRVLSVSTPNSLSMSVLFTEEVEQRGIRYMDGENIW